MKTRPLFVVLCLLSSLATGAACGNKIGDSCSQSTDCSQDGDRICDRASPGGYCTIEGCDFGTCPSESVCVRFFPVTQLTQACESNDDCAVDELCVSGGKCAPRSTERRFCMLTCESRGDCRDEYECRDMERMGLHGGEPVPGPEQLDETSFCAPSTPCTTDADCDLGDRCDATIARCVP